MNDQSVLVDNPLTGVTVVTLSRPDRLNALNESVVEQLSDILVSVGGDATCRVVVLTGSGRAFCAGLDLNGYGDEARVESEGHVPRQFSRQRELARMTTLLNQLPQPVIAAVNGPAAGGGFALVCGSDIRIAAESSKFAVSFIRAGYSACDLGVSWLLPRIVGTGRAHELMLTGRTFDAVEAQDIGLVTDVVPDDQLLDRAFEKAADIMRNAPLSVELTKAGMWHAMGSPTLQATIDFENRQQVISSLTEDAAEATRAFMEKRPALYRRR